jgi:hypothetical protein
MKKLEYVIAYLKNDNKTLDKLFLKESTKRRASIFEACSFIDDCMKRLVDCYSDNEIKFKKYLIKWTIKAVKKTINSNETHINDIENLSILIERFLIKAPKKFVLRKPLWVKHKSKYENNINYQNYVDSQFLTYVNQIMHVLESLR